MSVVSSCSTVFGRCLIFPSVHTPSPPRHDAFSHPFTHSNSPPSLPPSRCSSPQSADSLPVDAPNKATCVVSGCLGERSPCQPVFTTSTAAHRSALFSFLLSLSLSFPSPDFLQHISHCAALCPLTLHRGSHLLLLLLLHMSLFVDDIHIPLQVHHHWMTLIHVDFSNDQFTHLII